MMICGRNTMTLPTPEIRPFCRKLCSRPQPSGITSWINCPSAAKPSDNSSIAGCAQVNTAWNITNRITARITRPQIGCSTTESIRLVSVSGLVGSVTTAAMMRSASRCAALRSAIVGVVHSLAAASCDFARNSSVRFKSSSTPPLRTATEVTIGRPSSCDIRSRSIVTPRRFAMSIMLSTSIIGRRRASARAPAAGSAADWWRPRRRASDRAPPRRPSGRARCRG